MLGNSQAMTTWDSFDANEEATDAVLVYHKQIQPIMKVLVCSNGVYSIIPCHHLQL